MTDPRTPPRTSPRTLRRTLVVMRHGKAESSAASDAERALTQQGTADVVEAGSWLADRDVVPDHALVSAAVRTEQTWQALRDGAGWTLEADLDQSLYEAGVDTVVDLLRLVPDTAGTVVLVGHNPTMASLAQVLDDAEGDPDAGAEMTLGFATSALAVFGYDGSWADLGPATCSVQAFHVGRGRAGA